MEDFGEKLFIGFLVAVFAVSAGVSLWIAFGGGGAYVEKWFGPLVTEEYTVAADDVITEPITVETPDIAEVVVDTTVAEEVTQNKVVTTFQMPTDVLIALCVGFIVLTFAVTFLIFERMKNKREAERDEMSYKMYRKDIDFIDNAGALTKKYL